MGTGYLLPRKMSVNHTRYLNFKYTYKLIRSTNSCNYNKSTTYTENILYSVQRGYTPRPKQYQTGLDGKVLHVDT